MRNLFLNMKSTTFEQTMKKLLCPFSQFQSPEMRVRPTQQKKFILRSPSFPLPGPAQPSSRRPTTAQWSGTTASPRRAIVPVLPDSEDTKYYSKNLCVLRSTLCMARELACPICLAPKFHVFASSAQGNKFIFMQRNS